MCCGAGHRCGLDPELLWLWCRPAAAALIQPLAWKLPYAAGAALKKKKKGYLHVLVPLSVNVTLFEKGWGALQT